MSALQFESTSAMGNTHPEAWSLNTVQMCPDVPKNGFIPFEKFGKNAQ